MLMLMPRLSRGEASGTVSTAALTLKNLFTLSVFLYVTIKKAKKKATEMTEDVKYFPNA